jgi:hypothetical protein
LTLYLNGLYHPGTRASPRMPRGALVPTQHKSPTMEDDLAFEWLLCLARTVEASKRLRLTEVSEAPRHEEFPHTENRIFFKTKGKKAINPSGKES